MLRLIGEGVRRHAGRALALLLGVAVATSSFVLLTSAAETSRAETIGTVQEHARSAYDVLVRPKGTVSDLEAERNLVQDNYLSGIFGGITLDQYEQLKDIPGVEVAAPVANLGYVHVVGTAYVDLSDHLTGADAELLRATPSFVTANGLARYRDADRYIYHTSLEFDGGPQGVTTVEVAGDEERWPCWYFNVDPYGTGDPPTRPFRQRVDAMVQGESPFDPDVRTSLECYSERSPTQAGESTADRPAGFVGVSIPIAFPVLVAAVDPEQENALVGLAGTIRDGRYLRPAEEPAVDREEGVTYHRVPVLLATEAFADVELVVDVRRLDAGAPEELRERLDDGGARPWVASLDGEYSGEVEMPVAEVFERMVRSHGLVFSEGAGGIGTGIAVGPYWTPGSVSYSEVPEGNLEVQTVDPQPAGTWPSTPTGHDPTVPIDNQATQVRAVAVHPPKTCGLACDWVVPTVVGRFDPAAITGFSGLSRVPLESYRAPEVSGADDATRAALGGEPLRPDRNLGGYLRQPPALLTTLESIEVFTSTRNDPGVQQDAPISSVRIRVAGVTGVDELSRARVNEVVTAIHDRLGDSVDVEITVGASPAPQRVLLPAGLAGEQSLLVEEYWAQKGVGVRIVEAINAKSAALFGLVLVVCGLYLSHGALASVRSRRTELATLLALGWSRIQVFGVVLAELALMGVAGGLIGAATSLAAAEWFGIAISRGQTILAVPLAVMVALLAGFIPAYRASRLAPVEALRPPVVATRRTKQVHSLRGFALVNVTRSRGRTTLGAAGLALAVAALTVLLAVSLAFRGTVAGSLLGAVVIADVRVVDYVAVGISLVLGAVALVDVLVMNQRERAEEYATLAATGWSSRELSTATAYEGVVMAVLGGVAGAIIGLAVATALVGSLLTGEAVVLTVAAAGAAAVGGVAVVLVALLAPMRRTTRLAPAAVLAED
jgi:hypothetical protein